MKAKRLLLSVFTLFASAIVWADVEINEANFPDENFRSWVLSYYGADGMLTNDEITGRIFIDVRLKSIQSLKGIEYFTALTSLSCDENRLTALDVSKNTALTDLSCYGNQLTALDVSGCTALQSLICSDNQLTTLDVSGCTALTSLDCYYNQLTALDVSKNTALELLWCYSNQLTTLDVSKNTALTMLGCSDNQLTALDVSGCTALTMLGCSDNLLTELDVSGCTALTYLDCSDNQLTTLDVSKNTALEYLGCGQNQLPTLDVSMNTALWNLDCGQNQLTTLDLSKNTALTDLACYSNRIKGDGMDALVERLPTVSSGGMFVIGNENEQNVMTTVQVAVAKAKGWTPLYCDENWDWLEYAGSDPDGIRKIVSSPVRNGGEWYDLGGRRIVGRPTAKGIYIRDSRKVVIK